MIELIILMVLVAVVVMVMRYGKPAVLDTPIIVHQPGHYHITLAPQLNRAQPFFESIAKHFSGLQHSQGDIPTQYFEVRDPNVFAQGECFYLLAAAFRGGTLYFQAINPKPLLRDADSHLKTVRKFSESVLVLHPLSESVDELGAEQLRGMVESIAHQMNISVKILQEMD